MTTEKKSVLFYADDDTRQYLDTLASGSRSAKINAAIRAAMNKKSDEISKEPAAITTAAAGLSEPRFAIILGDKTRSLSRGTEFDQVLLVRIKQAIAAEIKLANKPDRWDDVLSIASASYICGLLLSIYNRVSGSQLRFVTELYGGNLPLPRVRAMFYGPAKSAHPAIFEKWTFEQWLQYLIDTELITVSNNENLCKATTAGRELIRFCLHWQLPLNKSL